MRGKVGGKNLREKETADHGGDIRVRKNEYPRYFLVETKGESSSKSRRSVSETSSVRKAKTRALPAAPTIYRILGDWIVESTDS